MNLIGIEIGGTKLQLAVGTVRGEILERARRTVEVEQGADGIQTQLKLMLPPLLQKWSPNAIGVGFGGPVNRNTGRIACSHQISGWSDFDLAGWLKGLVGLPVAVENDANAASLGEALCGAGAGYDPVFYVTLGSGVGGGFTVDGMVYHGYPPGEAEIGHLRLDRAGAIVEDRCSGWAVDRKIRLAVQLKPDGVLASLVGKEASSEARYLRTAWEQADADAKGILDETAEDLAFALSHVTHLFHPEIVVLGGGLSLVGEPLRSAVAKALPRFLMTAFAPGPKVALARLGEDSVLAGALLLAAQMKGQLGSK